MITYKETVLKITDLHYSIGDKVILRNINAEIKDRVGGGQVVALLGPSGAGKSTLFRLLSGLVKPTSGKIEVLLHNKDNKIVQPHEGIMGVVAQNYPLFEHLKVKDNLFLAHTSEAQIEKIVTHFGMMDHIDKFPCQLSGGQKQRIAIMQQILCSAQYLLMDEPFSGLDPLAKCEVCRLVKEVNDYDEYNTTIIVTHGIDDAIKVADTIWLLGRDPGVPGSYIKEVINLGEDGCAWKCCTSPDKLAYWSNYIMNKFKEL